MARWGAAVLVRSLAPGRPSPVRRKGAPPPAWGGESPHHTQKQGGPVRPPCGDDTPLRGGGRGSVPCAPAWAARGAWPACGAVVAGGARSARKDVPARCSARSAALSCGRPGPLLWCPGLCPRSATWAALRVRCRPPVAPPAAGALRGAPVVRCPGALRGKRGRARGRLNGHDRPWSGMAARASV